MFGIFRGIGWKGGVVYALFLIALDVTGATIVGTYVDERFGPAEKAQKNSMTRVEAFGFSLRPNYSSEVLWGSQLYQLRTNSLGMKDAAVRDVRQSIDRPRFVLMGDSIIEGLGVDFEDSVAGLLSTAWSRCGIETLNASAQAYSTAVYYHKTKWLVEKMGIKPDHLIVFADVTDPHNDFFMYGETEDGRLTAKTGFIPASKKPGESLYVVDGAGAIAARDELPPTPAPPPPGPEWRPKTFDYAAIKFYLKRFRKWVKRHSAVWQIASAVRRRVSLKFDEEKRLGLRIPHADPTGLWPIETSEWKRYGREGVEKSERYMDRLLALAREHGIAMTVAAYPLVDQIYAGDKDSAHRRVWREWTTKNRVPYVDLFPAFFADAPDPVRIIERNFIEMDAHLAKDGHALLAKAFLDGFSAPCAGAGRQTSAPRRLGPVDN